MRLPKKKKFFLPSKNLLIKLIIKKLFSEHGNKILSFVDIIFFFH
jgi:hypothetical protein